MPNNIFWFNVCVCSMGVGMECIYGLVWHLYNKNVVKQNILIQLLNMTELPYSVVHDTATRGLKLYTNYHKEYQYA